MSGASAARAAAEPANRILEADTEADLCEACYRFIVNFGIENVVSCVGRAARLRAADFTRTSPRLTLRHQRASAIILSAHQEILDDCDVIEQILEEERQRGSH